VEVRVIELSTVFFVYDKKLGRWIEEPTIAEITERPQLADEMIKETSHCATQTVDINEIFYSSIFMKYLDLLTRIIIVG